MPSLLTVTAPGRRLTRRLLEAHGMPAGGLRITGPNAEAATVAEEVYTVEPRPAPGAGDLVWGERGVALFLAPGAADALLCRPFRLTAAGDELVLELSPDHRAEMGRRRRRLWLVALGTLLLVLLGGAVPALHSLAIAGLAAAFVLPLLIWRCPACGAGLPRRSLPETCSACGAHLDDPGGLGAAFGTAGEVLSPAVAAAVRARVADHTTAHSAAARNAVGGHEP